MNGPAGGGAPRQEHGEAALVRRLRGPLPVPSAQSAARVASWLKGVTPETARIRLTALIGEYPHLSQMLDGVAEAAPFLFELIQADAARFVHLLESGPDEALAAVLVDVREATAIATEQAEVMRILRRMKAHAALLIALADIGNVWPVARITAALTDVAETALRAAVRFLLREAARREKLKLAEANDPEAGSGYIVLAMGKLGGHELNYSSDIDLMVFFARGTTRLASGVEPSQFYVRLTRDLVKILQERTPDGYVFRVDLRLRPDPSSTQVAISTEAALDYYEHRGQNWERAALIKARACAGDLAAGEKFLSELSPFIWRKYLDFATIAHVHEMKRRIQAYRGHGEIAVEGHNIKLGRGGIREIEFFVQTEQLIAGGRHAQLRGNGTIATLDALARENWISREARDELAAAYDFLRRVEHRLQMMADEQTHTLPAKPEALEVFARFLGFKDRNDFAAALVRHMRRVERHYVRLFERTPELLAQHLNLSFATGEGTGQGKDQNDGSGESQIEGDTLDRLSHMGFRQPHEVADIVRRWQAGSYRALRGEQARANLADLVPVIIDQSARAENPDAALAIFDRFLSSLRAGGRFFSLLRQNPELIRFVSLILSVAPRLADIRGAQSAFHRSAGRSDLLRRGTGRAPAGGGVVGRARRSPQLRDHAGCDPSARSGAHVSDRRANPVRFDHRGAGRRGFRSARRCAPAHRSHTGGDRFRRDLWPHPRRRECRRRAGAARRARDDGKLRSRSHRDLRFRSRSSGIRRRALALRRAILCPLYPTPDQRAHRADQLRRALSGRYAAASLWPVRPGGDADRRLYQLSGA